MRYIPLRMRPFYQSYLWGGCRLKEGFGKVDAPEVIAESWELASHPAGCSVVADGPLAGATVAHLGALDRVGFWGTRCREDCFPILVKFIDAAKDLSVQVHPSNVTALVGEQGKAEMWYVVECAPQAAMYIGFSKQTSKEEVLRRAMDGTICQILNKVPVSPGDVFYILPGVIHAIGAGIVLAEIQQSSDTTFRVYDYGRRDANGNFRPLHLCRAVEILNYTPMVPSECRANSCTIFPEFTMAEMFACTYFRSFRLDVRSVAHLGCDGTSFQHFLCVDGGGTLSGGGISMLFERGDSIFLPAALDHYSIEGVCRVLISRI